MSMTTRCLLTANMDSAGDPGIQYPVTKHGSSYPQIVYWLRVSCVWNYPVGWAYIKGLRLPLKHSHRISWALVRSPRTERFQKIFPQTKNKQKKQKNKKQKISQYPWWEEEIWDRGWTGLKTAALLAQLGERWSGSLNNCEENAAFVMTSANV